MNGLLTLLGIEAWKPVATALILPPLPFFLLLLIGARLILPRRGLGWFVILLSIAGLWLSACQGTAQVLSQFALKPPPALSLDAVAELKAAVKAKQPVAIVVLGGGADALAPEYGVSNLNPLSVERLRYALWLSRETGAPVAFSGGVGWGEADGQT
ncbi:MAG: YdcF family protein, partial [Rhizobacter sp.]